MIVILHTDVLFSDVKGQLKEEKKKKEKQTNQPNKTKHLRFFFHFSYDPGFLYSKNKV